MQALALESFDFAENFPLIQPHSKALERMQSFAFKNIAGQIFYHSLSNAFKN